jgi:predicted dehydrogenase
VVRRFENHAVGKRWIDEGRIGKITKIVRRRQRKNGGPTMQRRPWLSDPAMAADWLLYGFGSHEYDAILWLAGADATSAQATGESAGPEWAGWKTISSGMKLANGIEAECAMSTCAEVNVWDTVITGTDGTLTIDKQSLTLNGETTEVPTDDMEAFVVQMGEFAECVRTGREPGPSGRNVRATMALLEALRTSLEEGRPVDIADIES